MAFRWVRVVRRAASVGCAVNTGRTDTRRATSAISAAVRPLSRRVATVRASQPPGRPDPWRSGATPVDLFGDVRQVKIRHEGAHQFVGGGHVQAVHQGGDGGAVVPAPGPDAFHQVEDLLALEADKTLAQQIDHPAHIAPQGGIRVVSPGQTPRVVDGSHGSDRGEP